METIVQDFLADLTTTFPEKAHLWEHWDKMNKKKLKKLTQYFEKTFPERFFDILYQNEEIFLDANINTCFLPNVPFAELFQSNISEKTKQAMWKYLQLILLKIIDKIQSKNPFGDTADLFQGVTDQDLQNKMKETIEGLKTFFQQTEKNTGKEEDLGTENTENLGTEDEEGKEGKEDNTEKTDPSGKSLPSFFKDFLGKLDSEKLQEHLKKLMGGKIGSLVEELMEELKDEFGDLEKEMGGLEGGGEASIQEAMKKMMKNPAKFMNLVKKMTEKIKSKMKEGNNQEEFMRETADVFKEMGGKEGFMKMFEDMKKNMPKGARINEQALNQMEKQFKMKERMRDNLQKKKAAQATAAAAAQATAQGVLETTADGKKVFRIPGSQVQEKSVKETKAEVDALMEKMGLNEPTQNNPVKKVGKSAPKPSKK